MLPLQAAVSILDPFSRPSTPDHVHHLKQRLDDMQEKSSQGALNRLYRSCG